MSLINDALRRAKEAQQQAPSSPGPQLRPVEPAQNARHNLGLLLPVAFVAVAFLGLFFVWQLSKSHSPNQPAPSRVPPATQTAAKPSRQAAAPAVASVSAGAAPAARPAPLPATVPGLTASSNAPIATTLAPATAAREAVTNLAPAPAPPRPAPLKLQGIVFSPTRPSAVINGRTLFIGDRIGEFQVRAIDQDSATLVSSGQTKVLRLSE